MPQSTAQFASCALKVCDSKPANSFLCPNHPGQQAILQTQTGVTDGCAVSLYHTQGM